MCTIVWLVMRGYGSPAPLISSATQSAISPKVCDSYVVWVYAMRIEQRERMMDVFDDLREETIYQLGLLWEAMAPRPRWLAHRPTVPFHLKCVTVMWCECLLCGMTKETETQTMLRLVMRGYGSSAPLISAATHSAISPKVCGKKNEINRILHVFLMRGDGFLAPLMSAGPSGWQ